jgi:hypothetical protein
MRSIFNCGKIAKFLFLFSFQALALSARVVLFIWTSSCRRLHNRFTAVWRSRHPCLQAAGTAPRVCCVP